VIVMAVLLALFGGLFVRVAQLQTVSPERLVAFGEDQRTVQVPLPAPRGSLLDRNGEILALSVNRPTVWADPREVAAPEATANALGPVLGIEDARLTELLTAEGGFAYLARQVEPDVADTVMDLGLAGIHVMDEPARVNPADGVAPSLLGRVDVDHVGIAGIEERYDDRLQGRPGELVVERDLEGNTIASGDRRQVAPIRGQDLTLTIDRTLQHLAEQTLLDQVAAVGARGGMAVIAEPSTGDVLAMANIVDDPDDGSAGPVVSTDNTSVTSVFEPGSIAKIITVAGALEDGAVTPDRQYDVPSRLYVDDAEFSDAHEHGTSRWSVTDILTESSNVGTIMVAGDLGEERLDHYVRSFGFGSSTGVGLAHESEGLLLPLEGWTATSLSTIALGQGISVTALQTAAAVNVIANGGTYVAPRLVAAVGDDTGEAEPTSPSPARRVVSERTARQMAAMMTSAVDDGTGSAAAIDGYTVAGKTGTARKPLDTGGYEDADGNYRYVATFTGFVPANRPALSVTVIIDEPTTDIYGGTVAAPVFRRLAEDGLRRLGVPPPAEITTAPPSDPTE
jgi:cell division protein FtsI (penicillin-binding protein 3)